MPVNETPRANKIKPEVPVCAANLTEPKPGLKTPDANVDPDGQCTVPAYAETVRENTGEPCIDGRNWPEGPEAP